MPKLTILRGIPLSGKSTYTATLKSVAVLSRDDLRIKLFKLKNYNDYKFSKHTENIVTKEFNTRFDIYLKYKKDIVIDNTNLKPSYYQEYIDKAQKAGYEIEIKDFPISLVKALYRNFVRRYKTGKWIPIKVMWNMYKNFKKLKRNEQQYLVY